MLYQEKRVRIEDKWWAKLQFKLLGFWPESVVVERMRDLADREIAALGELAKRTPCPRCGNVMITEQSNSGPYMFCVECGQGGHD